MKPSPTFATRPIPRAAAALAAACAFGAALPAHADPVLIDLYRGRSYVPQPVQTPNYPNYTPPAQIPGATGDGDPVARLRWVQDLVAFGEASDTNRVADDIPGLVRSAPGLSFPQSKNTPANKDVLCQSDPATTAACVNSVQGAFLYTAVLLPSVGTYTIGCLGNDGAVYDGSTKQGTDYRHLGYGTQANGTQIGAGCLNGTAPAYGTNSVITTTQPNTLVNLRVAWNNWGNGAELVMAFTPSNGASAAQFYDPSAPATYIAASNDTLGSFAFGPGATTASVFANDRVNVATPVASSNIGTYAVTDDSGAPGVTLGADGRLSLPANLPSGPHSVVYQICRTDTNPQPLCATATASFTVTQAAAPAASNDSGSALSASGGTAVANVAGNDTVGGAPATLGASGNATVAPAGTWPAGLALDPATGAITVAPGTAPGTYNVQYQLCDRDSGNNGPHCVSATATVLVVAIQPAADSGSATAGAAGSPVANVAGNDKVNGAQATLGTSGNATVQAVGTWPAGIALDPASGAVTTSADVPPGSYNLAYRLCDRNSPQNCADSTVAVTVAASIQPAADSGSATAGTASPAAVANVAANDLVNGKPATLGAGGNASVAQGAGWPAGVSLDATTGAVATTADTPPGTYTLPYLLCDRIGPNCVSGTITLTVAASIVPTADSGSAAAGTPATPVANVAANDKVNGQPATLGAGGNATVAPQGTWPAGIALDAATGAISTTTDVPPGSYTVAYTLCDRSTPANCAPGSATITVTAAVSAAPDTASSVTGHAGTAIPNVAANDTVNGRPALLGTGGNATIAPSGTWPAGITLDPSTGAVQVDASVAPGTYALEYQLCDRGTPATCTIGKVTLVLTAVQPVPGLGAGGVAGLGTLLLWAAARVGRRRPAA